MMKDNHRTKLEGARATETGLGHDKMTATVAQWLTHNVQQEVLRVLHDALNDAAHSLEDPLWDNDEARRLSGWVQKSEAEHQTAVEPPPAAAPEPQLPVVQQGPQQPEPKPKAEVEEEAPEPPGIAEVQPPTTELSGLEAYGLLQEPPRGTTAEVYEGTVRLRVDATDSQRQVIPFVTQLRRKSDFRVLKLVGGSKAGVDIWVGLRAPMSVKDVLLGIQGVSEVEPADQLDQDLSEPLIRVRLAQIPSAV